MEQARSAIDLHMHSTASDGTDTIPELLQRKNNAPRAGAAARGRPGRAGSAAAERAEENDRIAQIVLVFCGKMW